MSSLHLSWHWEARVRRRERKGGGRGRIKEWTWSVNCWREDDGKGRIIMSNRFKTTAITTTTMYIHWMLLFGPGGVEVTFGR